MSQKFVKMATNQAEEPLNNVNIALSRENNAKVKKINLILLAITQLLGGLTFSLLSPFYTEEATQKASNRSTEDSASLVLVLLPDLAAQD